MLSSHVHPTLRCDWDGTVPTIVTDGQLYVKGFVHPILSLRKEVDGGGGGGVIGATTPIDLLIPGGKGRGYQGLIMAVGKRWH